MLVLRELGFQSYVLIFFFVFGSIVSFVIRWKWNNAIARKKEIMRLVAMASEEAARAELEAAVEYGTVSIVRQSQCALCYCPTTTRCSRCKAVRYCSGKCQIIHWRLGHKDECYPASTTFQVNGTEGDVDQKTVSQGDQDEYYGSNLETEDGSNARPINTFSGRSASSKSNHSPGKDNDKVGPFVDVVGKNIISESISTSSSVGCSATAANETLADASVSDLPVSSTTHRLKEPLFAPDGPGTKADVNGTELTKSPPSEYTQLDVPVDSISGLSNLKKVTPSFSVEVVECESTSSSDSSIDAPNGPIVPKLSPITQSDFWEGALGSNGFGNDMHDDSTGSSFSESGEENLPDNKSPLYFSFNLSQKDGPNSKSQCSEPKKQLSDDTCPTTSRNGMSSCETSPLKKPVKDVSVVKSSPILERSASVDDMSSDLQQLGPKGTRSSSFRASGDNPSLSSGRHCVSNVESSVAGRVSTLPTGSSEIANSLTNTTNSLKTSVRKVVQQFKVYKLSKHYVTGCESAERYKMLFPYELFVKLYHFNKVELHPCGLTNCGNSCYANSVLQCLAFTRPLTAYLLQGFHSKACPKTDWCFMCEFEGLILKAKEGKSPLSPMGILSKLQSIGSHLGHGREEDAHEFLRYVIDTMQSVCLKESGENAVGPFAEETTLIGLIFGGYLRSKIKCMKCHGKSERHERMMDLTVEIQGDIGTLEEALGRFTATEILDGENKYRCSRCRSYEKAKKKLTVLEAPNILTIALKRFQTGKFGKLNKPIQFPEILNLAPYMSGTSDKSPIYRLYAVVVHLDIMNAAFSGHYVCYVRNIQGKWFKIDDSTVKPVELERVLSKGAYMLLYARCSLRAPSLIRNTIISSNGKTNGTSRCSEAIPSPHSARPSSTFPSAGPSAAQRRVEDYPYWRILDGPAGFESFDRFHPMHKIHKVDSSSDNSSLLSCSDEGSCSTESTSRDSISTDEFSDYIFGETGRSLNSPLRVLEDSDGSSSPIYSRFSPSAVSDRQASGFPETSGYTGADRVVVEAYGVCASQSQGNGMQEGWHDNGSRPFFYSDTTKYCRNLTRSNNSSSSSSHSSSRDTDLQRLGWCNPLDVNSGVSQRRSTRESTVKTFY